MYIYISINNRLSIYRHCFTIYGYHNCITCHCAKLTVAAMASLCQPGCPNANRTS